MIKVLDLPEKNPRPIEPDEAFGPVRLVFSAAASPRLIEGLGVGGVDLRSLNAAPTTVPQLAVATTNAMSATLALTANPPTWEGAVQPVDAVTAARA